MEHLDQAGELERAQHGRCAVGEDDPTVALGKSPPHADQYSQGGRVEKARVLQVDHQATAAVFHEFVKTGLELGSGEEVDLAADSGDGMAPVEHLGRD